MLAKLLKLHTLYILWDVNSLRDGQHQAPGNGHICAIPFSRVVGQIWSLFAEGSV